MRILANYQDCKFLNLGSNKNGREPYVLRQDGASPGNSLRKKTAFFKMLPNCTSAVENLFGKPVVDDALPAGKSRAELPAGYRNCDL
jgi:hypothetical protein